MPFRSFRKEIKPGDPVLLYTAEAGDKHIQIRAASLNDDNLSTGFTFQVGGPDMARTGGLVCFNSEYETDVSAGDEIYVLVYGAAWTEVSPITAMVWSEAKPAAKTTARQKEAAA